MSLFNRNKKVTVTTPTAPASVNGNYSAMAALTLNAINDGVLLVNERGVIIFANPAAATMIGYNKPDDVINLNYDVVLRLENGEGMPLAAEGSPFVQAFQANEPFTAREYLLVAAQGEHRSAISLSLIPTGSVHDNRIITFRDITKELKDEQDKSEFISTASHEMRTPVASIEGYLALALNPQTATIDDRARQYLDAAHKASKHLGDLFRDLLDVTKLEDDRIKVRPVPVDIVATIKEMSDARIKDMQKKHLKYSFGTNSPVAGSKQVEQLVYASVDLNFLQEIMDNLIDNAIKYTPEGGEIWVNARGDGDKAVINVTDTGIGVSPEDAAHIFQKFYRVDNSQTRQIGGTGLGLYLVKQRVEAMNGRVWVESSFGDGSTFFVSLPRLTNAEYQKRKAAYDNEQAVKAFKEGQSVVANAMAAQIPTIQGVATEQMHTVAPAGQLQQVMPMAETVWPQAQVAAEPQMVAQPVQAQMTAVQPAAQTQVVMPQATAVQQPMANPVVPQEAVQQVEAPVPAIDMTNTPDATMEAAPMAANPVINQRSPHE